MSSQQRNQLLLTPHGRLRFLRSLTGLTRAAIEHKHNLPEITLKKWETGTLLLSSKGISRCISIYEKEGIVVNENWLISGAGLLPYFSFCGNISNLANDIDINYFKNNYPNALIYLVDNEDMLPRYKPKDIVIGFIGTQNVTTYNNFDCIVNLQTGETVLRKLIISDGNKLNLLCSNPGKKDPILIDAKVISVTPVVWHRIHIK